METVYVPLFKTPNSPCYVVYKEKNKNKRLKDDEQEVKENKKHKS